MRRSWMWSLWALSLILLFQNCERPSAFTTNDAATELDAGNGHPYDGIYVQLGPICTDGTFVNARIRMTSDTTAELLRQNCVTLAPVALASTDFDYNASTDTLLYHDVRFVPERPSLKIPVAVTWYYQLTGSLQSPSAQIFDIDLFETSIATIQNLKSAGHTVVCEFSAGTDESFRPDAASFTAADIGASLNSQEKWLDTRSANVRSLMLARLDLAKNKGCDGVDLDADDGYENATGFPLTSTTQTDYNQFLAFAAHDRKLVVALKNAGDLAATLAPLFDLAISEQCYKNGECAKFQPFTASGKAVLNAEQGAPTSSQCAAAASSSISLIYVSAALDGSNYSSCP